MKAASNPIPIPEIHTKNILKYLTNKVYQLKKSLYSTPNKMVLISGIPDPWADFEKTSQSPVAILADIKLKQRSAIIF